MRTGFLFHKDWNPFTYLPFIFEVDTCQKQVCSAMPENRKDLNLSHFRQEFHAAQCWQMSNAPFFFSFFQIILLRSHLSKKNPKAIICSEKKKISLLDCILPQYKKKTDFSLFILKCFLFFFVFNSIFVLQIPSFYNTKMLVYIFIRCSSTLEMPDCVSSGTEEQCNSTAVWKNRVGI